MNATSPNTTTPRLLAWGFASQGAGQYDPSTRLTHPTVTEGSAFVGEGPSVTCSRQTTTLGPGEFLIANGRSRRNGMTQALLALGVAPSGRIRDPERRQAEDDDPYWCGDDLESLLSKMAARFAS